MISSKMLGRRRFLALAAASASQFDADAASSGRILRGIFPIAQTPFTKDNELDIDALVRQLQFIDRGGVQGFVWPQLASEWSTLTESERFQGAEAIVSAGKSLRPAIVIGVQGPTTAAAVRYARHASKVGADAVIALPPPGEQSQQAVIEYYKQIGRATELPLFVQAVGAMSVDLILQMWKAIPTLKFIKDEAGEPLMRVGPLRQGSGDEIKVFTGAHGRTLIDEMLRGTSGTMPAASFADIYAFVWNLWHAGKHKEAMDLFGKALLFITEVQVYGIESLKYILFLRGVFKTYTVRRTTGDPPAASGLQTRAQLDDEGKQVLEEILEYVRPYLRA